MNTSLFVWKVLLEKLVINLHLKNISSILLLKKWCFFILFNDILLVLNRSWKVYMRRSRNRRLTMRSWRKWRWFKNFPSEPRWKYCLKILRNVRPWCWSFDNVWTLNVYGYYNNMWACPLIFLLALLIWTSYVFQLNLNFNASSDRLRDESKPVAPRQQCQSVDPTTDNVPATSPIQTLPGTSTQSELHETQEINSMENGGFFLPDLNMIPAEDCLWSSHQSWAEDMFRLVKDITLRSATCPDVKWRMIYWRSFFTIEVDSWGHKERNWQSWEFRNWGLSSVAVSKFFRVEFLIEIHFNTVGSNMFDSL